MPSRGVLLACLVALAFGVGASVPCPPSAAAPSIGGARVSPLHSWHEGHSDHGASSPAGARRGERQPEPVMVAVCTCGCGTRAGTTGFSPLDPALPPGQPAAAPAGAPGELRTADPARGEGHARLADAVPRAA
jgi:hypothetical protein